VQNHTLRQQLLQKSQTTHVKSQLYPNARSFMESRQQHLVLVGRVLQLEELNTSHGHPCLPVKLAVVKRGERKHLFHLVTAKASDQPFEMRAKMVPSTYHRSLQVRFLPCHGLFCSSMMRTDQQGKEWSRYNVLGSASFDASGYFMHHFNYLFRRLGIVEISGLVMSYLFSSRTDKEKKQLQQQVGLLDLNEPNWYNALEKTTYFFSDDELELIEMNLRRKLQLPLPVEDIPVDIPAMWLE